MTKEFWIDAAERIGWTALEAFLAVLIPVLLAGQPVDNALMYSASTAGLAAALTVLKTIAASFIGDPDSAAMLIEPGD